MVMTQRKRRLWVLYLGGADYEVPVLLQAGSPGQVERTLAHSGPPPG